MGSWVPVTLRAKPVVAGQIKWVGTRRTEVPRCLDARILRMAAAVTSVATWNTEEMMLEKFHDRTATGVVLTATVLRCGKQLEKLPHYKFSARPLSKTEANARFFPWRHDNPEVNYPPLFGSPRECFWKKSKTSGQCAAFKLFWYDGNEWCKMYSWI